VGVILRRGPAAWAHLTLWHTKDDIFEYGQWVKARIYEDRCDLAPDGSLFVYFAHRGTAYKYGGFAAWTGISRPPYFTALTLWPQASTYFGGGIFEDARTVLLNGQGGEGTRQASDYRPHTLHVRGTRGQFVEGWSYMQRLERDGWEVERESPPPATRWWSIARPPSVWRRRHPSRGQSLVMSYPGGTPNRGMGQIVGYTPDLPPGFGGYAVRFWVETCDGISVPLDGAAWADWDNSGRLVLARNGRLYAGWPERNGIGRLRELADFTSLKPDPQPSPEWARSWSVPSRSSVRRRKKLAATRQSA
jgi:hypothetical protein